MLVFASSVSAITANNLNFSWAGTSIDYISYNHKIPVDIGFSYSIETTDNLVASVSVDASGINTDIRYNSNYADLTAQCSTNDSNSMNYDCVVKSKVLNLRKDTIVIPITFTFKNGTKTQINLTKTFQVDNTKPQVTFIGPENCVQGNCYVSSGKPNKIKIEMQDSTASFARKRIAFKMGDQTGLVYECNGTTCYGSVTPTCTSGQTMDVLIVAYSGSPSQDDAGNPLTGKTSNRFICDSESPVIENINITSSSGLDAISTKDNVIVRVTATETLSPVLNISIDASSINAGNVSGTCTKTDNIFTCTSVIKPAINVAGDYKLEIKVTDASGNSAYQEGVFPLLVTNNETVKLWRVNSVQQSNKIIEKDNLNFPRTIYAQIQMTGINGKPILTSIKTSGNGCTPVFVNRSGHQGDIADLGVIYFDANTSRVYIKFTLRETGFPTSDRYSGLNDLRYKCGLSIISKRGQELFSTPEQENFTIKLHLSTGNSLNGYIPKEINSTLDNIKSIDESMKTWYKLASFARTFCAPMTTLEGTANVMTLSESTLSVIPTPPTQAAAKALGAAVNGIHGFTLGPAGAAITETCKYATCQKTIFSALNGPMENVLGPSLTQTFNDAGQISGKPDFISTLDPFKSKYIAYASLCPEAIVYHKNIEKGIECSYLQCLDQGVTNYGASLSSCMDQKNYATCVHDTGSALNAMPGISIIRDGMNFVSQAFKDPVHLFGVAEPLACMLFGTGTTAQAVCNIPVTVTATLNFFKSTQQQLSNTNPNPADQCGASLNDMKKRVTNFQNFSQQQVKPIKTVGTNKNIECYTGYCQIKNTNIRIVPTGGVDENGNIDATGMSIYNGNKLESVINYQDLKDLSSVYTNQKTNTVGGKSTSPTLTSDDFANMFMGNSLTKGNEQTMTQTSRGLNPTELANTKKILAENPYLSDMGIYTLHGNVLSFNPDKAEILGNANIAVRDSYVTTMNSFATDSDTYKVMKNALETGDEYRQVIKDNAPIVTSTSKTDSTFATVQDYADRDPNDVISPGDRAKLFVAFDTSDQVVKDSDSSFWLGNSREIRKLRTKETLTYGDLFTKDVKDRIDKAAKANKKKLDDAKEKIDDAASKAESAQNAIATDETFRKNFGSIKNTFATMFSMSNGITILQDLFNTDFASQGWKDGIMGDISRFFGNIANIEQVMCKANLREDLGVGQGTVLNEYGVGQFRQGAYISGRRSGYVESTDVPGHYDYFIGGSVTTNKKDGLTFKILLYSANGRIEDITYNITGENILML